jgi:uncharacterized protein
LKNASLQLRWEALVLIGFNYTLGSTYEMVRRLIDEKHIDYCELLIDNFLHVPPAELAESFDCPIGFHIMLSRFLECQEDLLEDIAKQLRAHIAVLRPLYVSDHVAHFSHRGKRLFHLGELDYHADYDMARKRVDIWQEMLGQRLYLENYPSIMDGGWDAPAFFMRLIEDTGAGVLFDASNAVCALRNCGAPLELWDDVIASTRHFHVSSYSNSFIEPYITVDAHDGLMAPDTLSFLRRRRNLFDKPGATMTYERDVNIEYDTIVEDLVRLREIFSVKEEVSHGSRVAYAG